MADLLLYTNPRSRGRTARWMLEETGAPYRAEIVAFGPPMRTHDFLALNPMAKVPVLVHGAAVVTEVAAICAYLAEAFPAAGLAPLPGERAAYHRAMFFAAGPVEQAVTARAMGFEVPGDREGMAGFGSFERMLTGLEALVSRTPFAAGDRFTAADVVLGAQVGWGMMFGTLPRRPSLVGYWARIEGRPALLRAAALDDAAMPPAGAGG
ncbi:MAG: glutathione S-transferase family protein [Rhodobacteraceae bacterium]|nr:glutathione S-transferase family protein [Paracoccaceae bacterium]